MRYSEMLIKPMREDLTNLGIQETRTPEEVDAAVSAAQGTIMVVVNSICGCAAGRARPGVALALQNEVRPQDMITVFAGADIEATERAEKLLQGLSSVVSHQLVCSGTGSRCLCLSGTRSKEEKLLRLPRYSGRPLSSTALTKPDKPPSATEEISFEPICWKELVTEPILI